MFLTHSIILYHLARWGKRSKATWVEEENKTHLTTLQSESRFGIVQSVRSPMKVERFVSLPCFPSILLLQILHMRSAAQACGGDQILASSCIYSSHRMNLSLWCRFEGGAAPIWTWVSLAESSLFTLVQIGLMGSSRLLSVYPSAAMQQVFFEVCGTRNLIPVSTPWPSDVEVNLHHEVPDSSKEARFQL
jgi:hypothetical protein